MFINVVDFWKNALNVVFKIKENLYNIVDASKNFKVIY